MSLTLLISISVLFGNLSCGQYVNKGLVTTSEVNIQKVECKFKDKNGFKLLIHLRDGNIEKTSKANNYGLSEFIGLNDSIKYKIVEKLLEYKNDTSTVCLPVSSYGYEGFENTCNDKPKTNEYGIQIDALYMINKLCFPHASSFFYCYPVLFDTLTGQEVNRNYSAVMEMFEIYEKWFANNKFKGPIPKDFPFNVGRFKWYGGLKSVNFIE